MTARRAFVAASCVALLAAHCGQSDDIDYTVASDASFVSAVEGAYAATAEDGTPVTLTVCEDIDPGALVCIVPTSGTVADCGTTCHRISAKSLSTDETLSTSTGCGCNGAAAELAVKATLVSAESSIAFLGAVAVVPSPGAPYGHPVALRVYANEPNASASLLGEVVGDGTMRLNLATNGGFVPDASPEAGLADGGVSGFAAGKLGFTRTAGPDVACP